MLLCDTRLLEALRDHDWEGKPGLIDGIAIHITTRSKSGEGTDMIDEAAVRVMRTLSAWLEERGDGRRFKEIWLVGGEPMMCPLIHIAIGWFGALADTMSVVTSGSRLEDEEFATKLLSNEKLGKIVVMAEDEQAVMTAFGLSEIRRRLSRLDLCLSVGVVPKKTKDLALMSAVDLARSYFQSDPQEAYIPKGTPWIDVLGRFHDGASN